MSVVEQERVEVVAPREVTEADVLERAAYGYEEALYGWHQGPEGGYGRDGNLCMVGALARAALELGFVFRTAYACPHVFALLHVGCASSWNDEPGRTKAEVVTALRIAAAKARQ